MSRIKGQFIPHRRPMLESPAWRMLPLYARQVIDALEIECMRHAGKNNGQITLTYADLQKYCTVLNKRALALAVRQAEALGFVMVNRSNAAGRGGARSPNQYRLTYMPGQNGGPPGDEWLEIQSEEDALNRLAAAKNPRPQTTWFKTANVVGFPRKMEK